MSTPATLRARQHLTLLQRSSAARLRVVQRVQSQFNEGLEDEAARRDIRSRRGRDDDDGGDDADGRDESLVNHARRAEHYASSENSVRAPTLTLREPGG